MTITVEETVQEISDNFHAMTDATDQLLADLSHQLQAAIYVRTAAGLSGVESQRTIRHLTATILNLTEARGALTLAHSSAEKEAEKAGLPWDCPKEAVADVTPILKLVKG
ncbi:MAG: hypothetical protein AAGK01_10205 [Pseudomonadota bacterium]